MALRHTIGSKRHDGEQVWPRPLVQEEQIEPHAHPERVDGLAAWDHESVARGQVGPHDQATHVTPERPCVLCINREDSAACRVADDHQDA
jgi:hypothetical protein